MKTKLALILIIASALFLTTPAGGQMFFPDDPLEKELPPAHTSDANFRELSDLMGLIENVFGEPGERHPSRGVIPAMGVNTMGEVLEGAWFMNRHAKKRMTAEELIRGPNRNDPPELDKPLQVLTVKRYEERPGMLVADSDNDIYLLRFDPLGARELSTGVSMVASRAYYALGYWVPENYIIEFPRSALEASPEGEDINAVGNAKKLLEEDIDLFLEGVPFDKTRGYRAVATKVPDGEPLGPYQFYGLRSDDPNDLFAHEHRRDLRGLYAFSAWLGNNWIRPQATFDFLVTENDVSFVRHYIVDFFGSLGSGWQRSKEAREGWEPWFDWDQSVKNFIGMGVYSRKWQRAKYPGIAAAGRFEYEAFDPDLWMPNTHLAPLANRLPDDNYWAARKVMAFTDEDIRALVKAGEYSDPRVEDWLAKCLIERRDKIGHAFFGDVLPLDEFVILDGELSFTNLAVRYGFTTEPGYTSVWTDLNIFTREQTPIDGATSLKIPEKVLQAEKGSYFGVRISAGEYAKAVDVFVRKGSSGVEIVGADWHWPGKRLADEAKEEREVVSRYTDLEGQRKELFDGYTKQYNERTGFKLAPEEYFQSLSISERTTFDAVTHALMRTQLTDESGASLGTALDLVTGINRIAGQYHGRQGDEQFRVYVRLKEGAREIVEKCLQFNRSHDNTVYHVGYPINFRQSGKVPTLQISMAEEGLSADIDVDYRSSKMPDAMWNGHLTSANSDVRAGNNYKRHNNRWAGLVAWWKRAFGEFSEEEQPDQVLMARLPPPDVITPLPPDRPMGAEIPKLEDAVQEFLTDWLVRHDYDQAMEFISDESLPCLVLSPESEVKRGTRKLMREVLEEAGNRLGEYDSLSAAIRAAKAWGANIRHMEHAYSQEFDLVDVSNRVGESFLCRNRQGRFTVQGAGEITFGTYYGALLRFRLRSADEGVLALLWMKENGQWRLASWDIIQQ